MKAICNQSRITVESIHYLTDMYDEQNHTAYLLPLAAVLSELSVFNNDILSNPPTLLINCRDSQLWQ